MTRSDDPGADTAGGRLSRRTLLTGAGAAVAGAGLVAGVPQPAMAGDDEASGHVGSGPRGATAREFLCRIAQTGSAGEDFLGVGYLTAARGAGPDELFAGEPRNETTALVTTVAAGRLVQRVLDQSVHALDIAGTLTVFHRASPGASFADPSSFRVGHVVAEYAVTLQDILAVFAPAQGLPTLTGDLVQERSGRLHGRRFGRRGARFRLLASGLGRLVDPVTLNAELEMAGNWAAE